MARANGAKTETPAQEPSKVVEALEEVVVETLEEPPVAATAFEPETSSQGIEDCLTALKTLLSTVEKLQKVRQEVGDIKPLLLRMLDGEVVSGEDLEQLKTGINGLSRLVRAYSDHQLALTKAQPARNLLDDVLRVKNSNE
jgi:hypothetical protein